VGQALDRGPARKGNMSELRQGSVLGLVGIGLVAAFGLGVLVTRTRSSGPVHTRSSAIEGANAPAAAASPVATPSVHAVARPIAQKIAEAVASAALPAQPSATAPAPETDQQRESRVAAQVQAQFETDPVPGPESWRMKRVLDDTFRSLSGQLSVQALECRQRLCRIELLFDSLDSDVQVLSDLFISGKKPELREFGGMMAPVREKRADGKVLTTVYLAREGDIEVFD